jgi:hypothetical protein
MLVVYAGRLGLELDPFAEAVPIFMKNRDKIQTKIPE